MRLGIAAALLITGSLASQAVAQPRPQQELCAIISETRSRFIQLQTTFMREVNPLRKEALGSEFSVLAQDLDGRLARFLGNAERPFEGFTGTVTEVSVSNQYIVNISLDCPQKNLVIFSALFSAQPRNELFGANDFNHWKSTLMNINKDDRVSVSGRFNFRSPHTYPRGYDKTFIYDRWDNSPNRPLVYSIYVTQLVKQ